MTDQQNRFNNGLGGLSMEKKCGSFEAALVVQLPYDCNQFDRFHYFQSLSIRQRICPEYLCGRMAV